MSNKNRPEGWGWVRGWYASWCPVWFNMLNAELMPRGAYGRAMLPLAIFFSDCWIYLRSMFDEDYIPLFQIIVEDEEEKQDNGEEDEDEDDE